MFIPLGCKDMGLENLNLSQRLNFVSMVLYVPRDLMVHESC